jgi:DNA repair exonuclease SbcCD nuclease subunit
MKTKFLTIGDLHLEALDRYFSNGDSYVYEQLDRIIQYAEKIGVTRIIQLGDIFDRPTPKQETVARFIEFLHKLSLKGFEFHAITGNHDFKSIHDNSVQVCSYLSKEQIIKNIFIYDKPQHKQIDGIDFFFAPFPCYQKSDFLENKPCFCFGHYEIGGALADNGTPVKSGVPKNALAKEDFWVIGHLHRQQELGRIYYPGTAYQLSFGEPLPKGFAIVEGSLEQGELNVSYEYIKLDTPYILENIYIENQEDFNKIEVNNQKYLYKIHVKDSNVTIPSQFFNGDIKNVYKIVSGNNLTAQENSRSLSEDFTLHAQETFFEPLSGLEEYLEKTGFSAAEIVLAMDKVQTLSQTFIQKR